MAILLLVGGSPLAMPMVASGERPAAPRLLPESTLAMVRIADTQQMLESFRETAMGKMSQDEQIKPLVSQVYVAAQDAWKQIEEQVGVPLEKILKIPQGEICLAAVPLEDGPPAIVALIDTQDQGATVRKLIESFERIHSENGGEKTQETIEQLNATVYTMGNGVSVIQIEKEGTFLFGTNKQVVAAVLRAWAGNSEEKTLAESEKFVAIMNRCGGADEIRPHVTWYVDPIEAARRMLRGTPGALGLALFPVLGLDGIQGIGGSMTFAPGEFDEVQHIHLLLDNPRAGVVDLVQFGGGDTTPENWVPGDAASYMTLHWKFDETFAKGMKLYDSMQEEGALERELRVRISDRLGIDVQKEVLPLLAGRVTFVNWIERPIRINSQTNILAFKLKDPQAAQPLLDKVAEKYIEHFERKSFGGIRYWMAGLPQRQVLGGPRIRPESFDDRPADEERPRPSLRQPEGCLCVLGDYLILCDSSTALHECILTSSGVKDSLAKELDYKLIAAKVKRQVGGATAGMVSFARPEQGMRFLYDLAQGEDARRFLERRSERNPFLRDVDRAMKDNPLPPFSVLAKYLAPSGGMLVSDETGLHYMTFTLKRKTPSP